MSASHRTPTIGAGIAAAFVLSACGAALLAVTAPWLSPATALRATIAALGLAYVLYAIGRSGERVGRIAALTGWAVIASAVSIVDLPLAGYVLAHLGLVWLLRSLYYYSGLLPALADLGVTALGAAFAVWAAQRSGSTLLAFWCFFLVQAFHAAIPASLHAAATRTAPPEDAFARAQRAAEAAVRRMSTSSR